MADITVTRPNRLWRRRLNGQRCVACNLRMHFTEVVRIAEGPIERFSHIQCVQLLLEALSQPVDGPAPSPVQAEVVDLTAIAMDPALD